MCMTCGCEGSSIHSKNLDHEKHHEQEKEHKHETDTQLLTIEKNILQKNSAYADQNRHWFKQHNIQVLNFLSSPGSGKTSLLIRTINELKHELKIFVVEGDQQTENDANKIRETGVSVTQINTGKGCHLDAHMISHAIAELSPTQDSLLFIENVGNLVCPALFDLGEDKKVVILSVTEGEDKPIKYPDMFAAADLMLINKTDLLPYVEFDIDQCQAFARRVNPDIQTILISAKTGEGMLDWYNWLFLQNSALRSAS